MSDRYQRRFQRLQESQTRAFMPFTMLGWPDRARCLDTIDMMIKSGAAALELGMAFSDPVADGPVIQKAAFETLEQGFSVHDAFALLKDVRAIDADIPIGILVYYNVVLAQGIDRFFQQAKDAGIDGVLVADLPVEAADEVLPAAEKHGINLIFIVSPVTTKTRLKEIVAKASGFLYLVSRLGVTGTDKKTEMYKELTELVGEIKEQSQIPVCAGFGISDGASAAAMLKTGVDGVIIGSRVIEIVGTSGVDGLKDLFAEVSAVLKPERLGV
ncbi:MAG TPA: tryptophan synthase subunit alpha [Chroococcales cyanobacterium]